MSRHPAHLVVRIWARITEPKIITLVQTVLVYGALAAGGAAALIQPPQSLEGIWGTALTSAWGWSLLAGGLVAAIACPFGWWIVEKPALLTVATGALMYGTVALTLHVTEPGNRIPQLAFIIAAIGQLTIRFLRIHRFAFEPGK